MIANVKHQLFSGLARIANQVLALDGDASERLSLLGVVVIACGGPGERGVEGLNLRFAHGRLALNSFSSGSAHAHIRGWPHHVLRYLFATDGDRELTANHVTIDGDADAVRRLVLILRGLDLDWEESASGLIGDTGAYMLGRFARGAAALLHETHQRVSERVSEYIAYEADVVITRSEVAAFSDGVVDVAHRVHALDTRIQQLTDEVASSV